MKGGPEYQHLPEQSHFSHIINGIFGLARFLRFAVEHGIRLPSLDETQARQAFALFTVHEMHKDHKVEKLGGSEFSVPLAHLRAEYSALGLESFAQVDDHLMRAANVHKRSKSHGDLLLSDDPQAARLWLLVRIADTFASVKSPSEAIASLQSYLADLSQVFIPQASTGKFALYYHEVRDVRGVLTNAIHQAVAAELAARYDLFPLLYFATGAVYIGPNGLSQTDTTELLPSVADAVLKGLTAGSDTGAARDALRRQKFDFQPYAYAFADAQALLEVVKEVVIGSKPDAKVPTAEIDGLIAKRKELTDEWRATMEERLGIQILDPKEHKTFNELWSLSRLFLLYVDTLLRDLSLPARPAQKWFVATYAAPADRLPNCPPVMPTSWKREAVGPKVPCWSSPITSCADLISAAALLRLCLLQK